MRSNFLHLQVSDWLKGLLMVVLTAIVTGVYELLKAGGDITLMTLKPILLSGVAAGLGYLLKNFFSNSQGQFATNEKGKGLKFPKAIILIFALSTFGLMANAQLNTKHLFGNITQNDVVSVSSLKSVSAPNYTLSYFLRITAAESAYEIPLFKGGGGQFFSATGLGLSVAAYDLSAVEKFSANFILFVPNTNSQINGVSTALTIGVPIPKLNLPNINVGIREDWKAKVTYLQTSITLEF